MKQLFTCAAIMALAASAAAGPDAADRRLALRRTHQGAIQDGQPVRLRMELQGNDEAIALANIYVSWPQDRGDISALNTMAQGTWANTDGVMTSTTPPLDQQPQADDTDSANERRAISGIDFIGVTSFQNGDLFEFEFTLEGPGHFVIWLKPTGNDTLANQDAESLEVATFRRIAVTPGSDPLQLVLGNLLGQQGAVPASVLDSTADGILDATDLRAYAGD